MASIIKVDNIQKVSDASNIIKKCGSTITLGSSGQTVAIASGATTTGMGRTGTVDWDTSIKTGTVTAVTGKGYFVNTTSGGIIVNLPVGAAGSIVSMADYAATWQTNNVTVTPNGAEKIGGVNDTAVLSTEGQSITLVYVDATQGWLNTVDSTSNIRGVNPSFVTATGGTPTTCGDYKIHTFTGPGTLCVSDKGNVAGSNSVDYMVIAGGGGGGWQRSGGGGGGGYRESPGTASGCYAVSPLGVAPAAALLVTVQGYPISVGAAGAGSGGSPHRPGYNGGESIFSTITSAGGGGGGDGNMDGSPITGGLAGGSGGGGGACSGAVNPRCGGAGNTPPTSPAQGTSGGDSGPSVPVQCAGGGGGGATVVGTNAGPARYIGGPGGTGATSSINGTPTQRAGGGGGGSNALTAGTATGGGGAGASSGAGTAGTTNTGGGGGGSAPGSHVVAGGSGIVVIRYKFQ